MKNFLILSALLSAQSILGMQEFMTNTTTTNITIKAIEPQHVPTVRTIILQAVMELQIIPCTSLADLEEECKRKKELDDLDDIESAYFANKGTFLVVLDGDQVVGSGAIRKQNDEICELRRLFFAPTHRGMGLGRLTTETLITEARKLGYKKMRLDVYNVTTQKAAVALYKKLGFYEIPPYRECRAQLFMEKIL